MALKKSTYIKIGVVVLVVAAAVLLIRRGLTPDPITVVVKTAEKGTVESTVANTRAGTIEACRRAKLSPAAGGNIAVLNVKEGSRVKASDVLLEVWNEDIRAELRLGQGQIAAAKAQARQTCLMADVSDRDAARSLKLESRGLSSEQNTDTAVTDAAARKAACNAAQESVNVAQAQLEATGALLERTILRAPFDGIVAEVNAELGEFATPSPPGIPTLPAVDLIDDSCIYVSAPIDEVDAPAIQKGMPARISLDAFPGKSFPGHVRRIAPYVLDREKQARTVEVEVEFDDPETGRTFLVGYSADIEVILEAREDVLRVPAESVLEGNRVFVYDPAAKVIRQRRIEKGLANWEHVEVRSGIQAGDMVVTSVEREGLKEGASAKTTSTPGSP